MTEQITLHHFEPGARWEFVARSGKRTEYVYDRQIVGKNADPTGKTPGLDAMHALLNPATGNHAQVTEKWLREGPVGGGFSHWLPKTEAIAEAA